MDAFPIRVVVPFDPLKYAVGSQAIMRGALRPGFLGAIVMYGALEGYTFHRDGEFSWYGLLGMVVFLILCYFTITSRRFLAWQLRRSYIHVPPENMNTTWEIDSSGLRYASISNTGNMGWTSIDKIVRIPEGYMIVAAGNIANWLPNEGFESEAARESFGELARVKSRSYRDRSGYYFPFV